MPEEETGIVFARFILTDGDGTTLQDNIQWFQAEDNFTALEALPEVDLDVSASSETVDGELVATLDVENPSDTLAFFVNLVLLEESEGKEVLPSYWSDNYFILMPGDATTVTVAVDEAAAEDSPVISVEGFNITTKEIRL